MRGEKFQAEAVKASLRIRFFRLCIETQVSEAFSILTRFTNMKNGLLIQEPIFMNDRLRSNFHLVNL